MLHNVRFIIKGGTICHQKQNLQKKKLLKPH